MASELIHPLWAAPLNWAGDRLRSVLGAGPRWVMHLRLARKLVDKQSWGMFPLFSGMQSPIFDALRYLTKVGDVDSIPRLEALLETYSRSQATLYEHKWQGMRVVHSYGPQDYVPQDLQRATVRALLALHQENSGATHTKMFIEQLLCPEMLGRLHDGTLMELCAYIFRTGIQLDRYTFVRLFARVLPNDEASADAAR